jgi:hypothetical protein
MQKNYAIWCNSWENAQHCSIIQLSYFCAKFAVLSAALNIRQEYDVA